MSGVRVPVALAGRFSVPPLRPQQSVGGKCHLVAVLPVRSSKPATRPDRGAQLQSCTVRIEPMLSRRTWLAGIASTVAGPCPALPKNGYAPSLLGQTFVWFQYLRRLKRTIADGIEEILSGYASAGYHALELTADFFEKAVVPLRSRSTRSQFPWYITGASCITRTWPPGASPGSLKSLKKSSRTASRL